MYCKEGTSVVLSSTTLHSFIQKHKLTWTEETSSHNRHDNVWVDFSVDFTKGKGWAMMLVSLNTTAFRLLWNWSLESLVGLLTDSREPHTVCGLFYFKNGPLRAHGTVDASPIACITGALWAKRGKHSILCEAWEEGRRKTKRLLPVHCSGSSRVHECCVPILVNWWRVVLACLFGTK